MTESSPPQDPPCDAALRRTLELIFFAHLNMARDADRMLEGLDMSRAHHRVLYFVVHSPGQTVNELLQMLRITHQGASRPMNRLLQEGYIEQRTDPKDRRQRRLYPTAKGIAFTQSLARPQFERIGRALATATQPERERFWAILSEMLEPIDVAWLRRWRGDAGLRPDEGA